MASADRHDCAIAFCCDRNYFPFALFVIWQIAHHNPQRKFDFVVSSPDELVVPDWAKAYQIVLHRPGPLPEIPSFALLRGSSVPLLRLMLARELGDRYRRILYLDCDLFIEGGDVNRLLETDIGAHPVGAVLNAGAFLRIGDHPTEYRRAGLPALPYFNSGLTLIDTCAYREQDMEQRSFSFLKSHPHAVVLTEQSLLNLALRGKFAQLAPCWNWQVNGRLPLMTHRYPVFVQHFITRKKPNVDSSGRLDARFNLAYREFFARYMPAELKTLAPPCDPAPMSLRDAALIVLNHLGARKLVADILGRHPDPYTAIL